jgi:hypothetical protein
VKSLGIGVVGNPHDENSQVSRTAQMRRRNAPSSVSEPVNANGVSGQSRNLGQIPVQWHGLATIKGKFSRRQAGVKYIHSWGTVE